MKYLAYYGGSYVPKNQLEKDQNEYLKSLDRALIHNDQDLESFKNNTIAELNRLNAKNHRCKPIKCSFARTGLDQRDWFITGIRVVHFKIYRIDKEFGK